MADVQPLQALHYDLSRTGGLQAVAAPPYDVIDPAQRAELVRRSPYNVVEVDLPQNGGGAGRPPALLRPGRPAGGVLRATEPAWGALDQHSPGPDARPRTRHGIFARVRVED